MFGIADFSYRDLRGPLTYEVKNTVTVRQFNYAHRIPLNRILSGPLQVWRKARQDLHLTEITSLTYS